MILKVQSYSCVRSCSAESITTKVNFYRNACMFLEGKICGVEIMLWGYVCMLVVALYVSEVLLALNKSVTIK
jgi:uncharacterized membrane protein